MNATLLFRLLKKGAAILLVLCFFMPLSKCESKVDTQGKIVTEESYNYPYSLIDGAGAAIAHGEISEVFSVAAMLATFFLPLIALAFSAKWQAGVYVVASFAAQYWLCLMTYLYMGIQIGGVLAIGCWVVLFVAGCGDLWRHWRERRVASS